MRNTPVIVFVNKMDREGQSPFDLLDEIEKELKIKVRPLTWPIGIGKSFKGVYNLTEKSLNLFQGDSKKPTDGSRGETKPRCDAGCDGEAHAQWSRYESNHDACLQVGKEVSGTIGLSKRFAKRCRH
jgi:peptide subunit release factor RF-3